MLMMRPRPRSRIPGPDLPAAQECARDVRAQDALELFERGGLDAVPADCARAIDENVYSAESLGGTRHEMLHLRLVRHVGGHRQAASSQAFDLRRGRREPLGTSSGNREIRAPPRPGPARERLPAPRTRR